MVTCDFCGFNNRIDNHIIVRSALSLTTTTHATGQVIESTNIRNDDICLDCLRELKRAVNQTVWDLRKELKRSDG